MCIFLPHGISILRAHGKSARDSYLLNGYALNIGRAAQGMLIRVAPAKIACIDFNLQKNQMQPGVQVVVTDPWELKKICQRYDMMDLINFLGYYVPIGDDLFACMLWELRKIIFLLILESFLHLLFKSFTRHHIVTTG